MEFKVEQLVDSFTKRYIEDVVHKTNNELFAIFDLISEEYNKTNECPICSESKHNGISGMYSYNNAYIGCNYGIFNVMNDVISFTMKANYCPVCGKKIS